MELLRQTGGFKLIAIRSAGVVAALAILLSGGLWILTVGRGISSNSSSFVHRGGSRIASRWFFATKDGVVAVGHLSARYPEPRGSAVEYYSMDRIHYEFSMESISVWGPQWRQMTGEPRNTLLRKIGFEYTSVDTNFNGIPYSHWWLGMPYWFLMLLMAVVIAPWLRLEWREWNVKQQRRRFNRGLCPVCSYDVHATPQRCPECGCKLSPWLEGDDDRRETQLPADSRQ